MAPSGRKPIDLQRLDHGDRQWFMAFHELREGLSLPIRPLERWFTYEGDGAAQRVRQLERMNVAKYWADFLSHDPPRSRRADWEPPPLAAHRAQVERLQKEELAWLKQRFEPERILARSRGLKIWDALWRARTIPTLADACKRWIGLHHEEDWDHESLLPPGRNVYPVRILDHAKQFLAMERDRRFPRSEHANNSRRDYLARGMAGLDLGLSPLTAIERLRNLKHGPGGPLWYDHAHRCSCWRCLLLKEQDTFYERLGEVFVEGRI